MIWILRYTIAALPGVITVGGWQLAEWAFVHFGCQWNSKGIDPCFVGTNNIQGWLGIGLFWCHLIAYLAVPFSIVSVIVVALLQFRDGSTTVKS